MKKNVSKNTKPFVKKRLDTTTYEKKFKSFDELVNELRDLHPEFSNIFRYADDVVTPTNMLNDVANYFVDNMPNLETRENLPVSINLNANKVTLKTNRFFIVKWQFRFDNETKEVTNINALITVLKPTKLPQELTDMINILEDSWEVKVYPDRNEAESEKTVEEDE